MSDMIDKIKAATARMKLLYSKEVTEGLKRRYDECDSHPNKHVGPVIDKECMYCYRHTHYEVNGILKDELAARDRERAHLSELDQPMDAPVWISQIRENIEFQKGDDYHNGLFMIARKMYPNEFPHLSQ